jgi:deoxyribodipyrimidine photo-lyase
MVDLVKESGAQALYWHRGREPAWKAVDQEITAVLTGEVELRTWGSNTLFEPASLASHSGKPYTVFTAFWNACLNQPEPSKPLPAPDALRAPPESLNSETVESLRLLPSSPDWAQGLRETWTPGEAHAMRRLEEFTAGILDEYAGDRDRPDRAGTSGLSPHLRFGELSARQAWHAVCARKQADAAGAGAASFLRELGWREFASHLLYHHPTIPDGPMRREFERFPWRNEAATISAWQRGETGYPIVDAGMRQLWHTGWMHNRIRMIVTSFLTKHLLTHWRKGQEWFWDTLVDADLASNAMNWQWVAGCGFDAAPYFRIFNPVLQGSRFDPDGQYVRRWVPELGKLPASCIHSPWLAPPGLLASAGVRLGSNYPEPIVDLKAGRQRALAAYAAIRGRDVSGADHDTAATGSNARRHRPKRGSPDK